MEFLQLRYFYESAKCESFALTAKKHLVPTSSVSASIKRLESELGVTLFDRSSNRIRLNENGYAFYRTVEDVFERMDRAVSALSDTVKKPETISILVKARRKWITELIIQYKEDFPHVQFQVSHDALITSYDSFDVIIDEKTDKYADRESFLLSVEHICIKTYKGDPLTGRELTLADLKDKPFVITQRGNRMWQRLEKAATRCGFVPQVSIESNDRQCLIRYAEAGMGLALGSISALADQSEKNLAALNVTDFNETQLIYV